MSQPRPYRLRDRNTSGGAKQIQTDPIGKPVREDSSDNIKTISEDTETQKSTQTKEEIEIPIMEMHNFEIVDMNDKLNLLMAAINKVNTSFHYTLDSLKIQLAKDTAKTEPRLAALEQKCEVLDARLDDHEAMAAEIADLHERLDLLEEKSGKLKDNVGALKGIAQVHDKAITASKNKITDLMARSMVNNLVIFGLQEEDDENCKDKVLKLFHTTMLMNVDDEEVETAHRTGKKVGTRSRQIVVKCKPELKQRVFKFTKNLKDFKNSSGESITIKSQLPEPLLSERIERENKMCEIKKANAEIPEEEKHRRRTVHIKNKVLYVNNIPQKASYIHLPLVKDLFTTDAETQDKMDQMHFVHMEEFTEKGSTFCGHAVRLKYPKDVKIAYREMRSLYPESGHVIMSYIVKGYSGHCDHGEYGAGKKLLNILQAQNYSDVVLFVTREYGGTQLGQRHFMFIEKSARHALDMLTGDLDTTQ